MPQWAHLPLIMGPNGKLSKRDGARFGFPVFAMTWTDPRTGETTEGFREKGFLPQAFINLLAVLGWNDGTEQELYSLDELISHFSMDRVHKAGAKFDYDKATWFNHEWIKKLPAETYAADVQALLEKDQITVTGTRILEEIMDLVKDRVTLLPDFIQQAGYFFRAPAAWDLDAIQPKWNAAKQDFFQAYVEQITTSQPATAAAFEQEFKALAEAKSIKPGELQLPLRVMLVGGKFGPGVFLIAEKIGAAETVSRINAVLSQLNS
jgi:glutamyl-tRNA synthetase